MDTLLAKFKSKVNGVLTGFDRIVFKGIVQPIMHAAGMESFLAARRVLNKDFKSYAMSQSQAIVESAEEMSKRLCDDKTTYISSVNERKESLAHERQQKSGAKEGLIGIWSCVESCNTFRSVYDPTKTYPSLRSDRSKCKHLYYYFDDPVYGFMSVRMQTWAPYEVQVAINGREWLRRSLDKAGCGYLLSGNKFLHIDDYELAQRLLDEQPKADFVKMLDGFLNAVFPARQQVLGPALSYYWTFWQSEVAKDYVFNDIGALGSLMDDLQIHALMTGNGKRILKYFGKPVRANGQPHHLAHPEIVTHTNEWYDGLRVRHWLDKNSVKFYNEGTVFRIEMTMNDPSRFKIYRHVEHQCKDEPKKFLPMRKGIADAVARAEVSKSIVNRFDEHLAAVEEKTRLGEVLATIASPITRQGKRHRAIDAFGKDRELLGAISDPAFYSGAITNKALHKSLKGTPWAKGMSGKQLSGRITRHLRLLREHGLIKKLPKQRKYALTDKGRMITAALDAALSASVNDLLRSAA